MHIIKVDSKVCADKDESRAFNQVFSFKNENDKDVNLENTNSYGVDY